MNDTENTGDGSLRSDKQSKTQRTVPCVTKSPFPQLRLQLLLHLNSYQIHLVVLCPKRWIVIFLGVVHNMKFRKNWGAIWQEVLSLAIIVSFCVFLFLYALINRDKDIASVTCCALFPITIIITRLLKPGFLTDMIELDINGVAFRSKNTDFIICWEDIKKIIRTRYKGTNALVVMGKDEESIWFYRNKKIERTIVEYYPLAKDLFTNDRHFFDKFVRRDTK